MPFRYPDKAHIRRHGPRGYLNYESYRPWLRDEFSFRCVFCLQREQWGGVNRAFEIDHFVPTKLDPISPAQYDNLLYVCSSCNSSKRGVSVPNPLIVFTSDAVTVLPDGVIVARTKTASRLIRRMGLDSAESTAFRRLWIDIIALAKRFDPNLYKQLMRYPEDLPDLAKLLPPGGNSRPGGISQSWHSRKKVGVLSSTY